MQNTCAWSSTRSLMLILALIALCLANAMATWKFYPLRITIWHGNDRGLGSTKFGAEGVIEWGLGDSKMGYRLVRVVKTVPPLSRLKIWSPVIASTALIILFLVVPIRRRPSGIAPSLRSPAKVALSWTTIVCALIVLDVACFMYPLPPYDFVPVGRVLRHPLNDPGYPKASIDIGPFGVETVRELYPLRRENTRKLDSPPEDPNTPLGDEGFLKYDLRTIVYNEDGSIVGYEGKPGETKSRPILLYPPVRSALTMWSPFLLGLTTTVVVLVVLWRQIRHRGNPEIGS